MKTVLFLCVHNASRSQMAEAFVNRVAKERGIQVRAVSAGTVGGKSINPVAVQAMAEIGIDMSDQKPKLLTQAMADAADRIVTMGCGVDAAACPARFLVTEDWALDDPHHQPIEVVRIIRDEIRTRVESLVGEYEAKTV
ncbi:MAG TPA: arsenate reductase ArsC [Fimbriimonadaceae bacterium]|nr:arsenate reductase ArsC [Fimbriimonadaceae bacterium]